MFMRQQRGGGRAAAAAAAEGLAVGWLSKYRCVNAFAGLCAGICPGWLVGWLAGCSRPRLAAAAAPAHPPGQAGEAEVVFFQVLVLPPGHPLLRAQRHQRLL